MNNILSILATQEGKIELIGEKQNNFNENLTNILNWIVGILGIVAVIVIIIGGVNYMTSAGDAGKVKKAKDTILYGIIGLIVAALAFAIVNWVISAINGGGN